ncbi:MAG: polysaccharide biosynthesis tyrosine autokinase [Verrucomicrobiota bacterium]
MFWEQVYRYKTLLKRHWWVPFLTVSLAMAYSARTIINRPISFESVGKMKVSPLVNTKEAAIVSEESTTFFGNQKEILESSVVRQRAQSRVQLENPNVLGDADIVVLQNRNTSIFTIVGTGSDPKYTQLYVNALMNEFVSFKREERDETVEDTAKQMNSLLEKTEKELKGYEKDFYGFKEKNNMTYWEEQSRSSAQFLSQLKTKKSTMTSELQLLEQMTAEQLAQRAKKMDGSEASSSAPKDFSTTLEGQYLSARQQLIEQKSEQERLALVLKPRHPKMIKVTEEVSKLQRLITILEQQNKEASQVQLSNLKADNELRVKSLRAELVNLDASLKEWEEKALEANRKDAEYQRLTAQIQRTKESYDQLLKSVQSLDIGKNVNQELIRVMQWASEPKEISKGVIHHFLSSLVIGFALGIGIILLINKIDDRIGTSNELYDHFKLPVLAQLPYLKLLPGQSRMPLLATKDDRKLLAEAYRNLRSSLLFLPNRKQLKTLMVTSSVPKEGKSTVSCNLAITMALAETSVLLVDADLRMGLVASEFGLDPLCGFSDVLEGGVSWESAVLPTQYPNLHVLPSGNPMHTPGDFLLGDQIDAILEEMKGRYGLIIFDTAPILAADDTTSFAPKMDGVVMVFRANYTTARQGLFCLESLKKRNISMVGMVLNGFSEDVPDNYYYKYRDYYAPKKG